MPYKEGYVHKPLVMRFLEKFTVGDGCWEWTAFRDKAGYARIQEGGRKGSVLYAHRLSYELFIGPIPEGMVIDHLCRNRGCVNPTHMEIVTNGENVRRGMSPTQILSRKGECIRGHKRTPENTYIVPKTGSAQCRICRRERRERERVAAGGQGLRKDDGLLDHAHA